MRPMQSMTCSFGISPICTRHIRPIDVDVLVTRHLAPTRRDVADDDGIEMAQRFENLFVADLFAREFALQQRYDRVRIADVVRVGLLAHGGTRIRPRRARIGIAANIRVKAFARNIEHARCAADVPQRGARRATGDRRLRRLGDVHERKHADLIVDEGARRQRTLAQSPHDTP